MSQKVPTDLQDLKTLAKIGIILGRNIERASAFWALVVSALLILAGDKLPVYQLMQNLLPLNIWGWLFGVISSARILTLIVNGIWPITLQVRIAFSLVTLGVIWMVMTASYWVAGWTNATMYAGIALAPYAATVELLCFLSLRTRLAANKDGGGV